MHFEGRMPDLMVTLQMSNIPAWLEKSSLAVHLRDGYSPDNGDDDDDGSFTVSEMMSDSELADGLHSTDDLMKVLRIMAFWGLYDLPDAAFDYVITLSYTEYKSLNLNHLPLHEAAYDIRWMVGLYKNDRIDVNKLISSGRYLALRGRIAALSYLERVLSSRNPMLFIGYSAIPRQLLARLIVIIRNAPTCSNEL